MYVQEVLYEDGQLERRINIALSEIQLIIHGLLRKKSKKHVAKRPTTQKARHPKLSAKGVGKTIANNTDTTNTNVLSIDILNQLNDSSLCNISKFKLVLSLSGAQRKAADQYLMKQLGLYYAGKPVISISIFEKTLKENVKMPMR